MPDHCLDGGDTMATCTSFVAPMIGYTCNCNSSFWTTGTVSGNNSCVDVDECANGNPCVNGTCTNVPNGGGYTCACNQDFVSTGGMTPVCVHDFCALGGNVACVTSKAGNVCANQSAGYTCTCGNPGYKPANRHQECILATSCNVNHCAQGGDANALCSDLPQPQVGYTCTCDPGFAFDGTTCSDVDECRTGGNPCGQGDCNNTQGGYTCSCAPGYASSGGAAPTCVASVAANGVTYTVSAGSGCDYAAGTGHASTAETFFICAMLLLVAWRRSRRA